MSLEDELSDILKKARNGQQRSVADVASASGLSETEVTELERGQSPRSREQVRAIAQALGLMAEPLTQVVDGWTPQAMPPSVPHVETVLGSVGGYEVKGYIVHDGGEPSSSIPPITQTGCWPRSPSGSFVCERFV